jgi:ABC-type uncharacterized transport system permease subunit
MGAWFAAGLAVALAYAWVAAKLHAAFVAPIGSLSIGFGLVLGATLGAFAALLNVRPQRNLIVGAALLTFVAIIAQHAWLYVEFRREWHKARATSPEIAMFRPESPWSPVEYFGNELKAGRAPVWCLDAVCIAVPAITVFWIMDRKRLQAGAASETSSKTPNLQPPAPSP